MNRAEDDLVKFGEKAGVAWSKTNNMYSPEMISKLLIAEYNDFASNVATHKEDLGKILTEAFTMLPDLLTEAGFAQLKGGEGPNCYV